MPDLLHPAKPCTALFRPFPSAFMHRPVTIESVRLRQVNLAPKVIRTDAIQSFVTQEMELHEYIPQLDDVTTSRITVVNGHALPPATPRLGIEWDWPAIEQRQVADLHIKEKA